MKTILEKSQLYKLCFILMTCLNVIVLALTIWILKDPILEYFYASNGVYGKENFDCKAFLASLYISLFLFCFSLFVTIFGLITNIKHRTIKIMSETKLNEVIYEEIRNYFYLHESSFLDTMHTQLECCGIRGWNDFVRQMDRANRTPRSCLLIENQLNVGCTSKLIPYINTKWITLIVFYVIFIISQITTLMSVLIKIKWQFKTQHSSVNNG
ncbi:uncharacterized protein [Centruroides vittatus]|uniref:uncharacterized protein isoform X2 n=1 Tax=Centruroides vittatus TaxID=120091 RepID=UPI00350EE457